MSIKSYVVATASALMVSTAVAGTSQAAMVAGWDFSQYLAPAALTIDGAEGTNVLAANYSDLDPTGLGPDSGVFGTMYINGLYGSSLVDPFGSSPEFVPTDINLTSNLDVPGGTVQFNQLNNLIDEGQIFANELGMVNQSAVQVVFGANLMGVPGSGSDWSLSFGGRTESGVAAVQIEFSTDGSTYFSFGSVNLTAVDTPFDVVLGTAATDTAYVRMTFAAPSASVGRAVIDNLALNATVPEPTAALLCIAGLGMAVLSGVRRRSANA
jgi:hypothetical protein